MASLSLSFAVVLSRKALRLLIDAFVNSAESLPVLAYILSLIVAFGSTFIYLFEVFGSKGNKTCLGTIIKHLMSNSRTWKPPFHTRFPMPSPPFPPSPPLDRIPPQLKQRVPSSQGAEQHSQPPTFHVAGHRHDDVGGVRWLISHDAGRPPRHRWYAVWALFCERKEQLSGLWYLNQLAFLVEFYLTPLRHPSPWAGYITVSLLTFTSVLFVALPIGIIGYEFTNSWQEPRQSDLATPGSTREKLDWTTTNWKETSWAYFLTDFLCPRSNTCRSVLFVVAFFHNKIDLSKLRNEQDCFGTGGKS